MHMETHSRPTVRLSLTGWRQHAALILQLSHPQAKRLQIPSSPSARSACWLSATAGEQRLLLYRAASLIHTL